MVNVVWLILVVLTLIGWGFGDFFLQRSVRKIGDWETLFIVTFIGAIALTPFIFHDFSAIFSNENNILIVLLFTSVILFGAALLDFEALKKGKLAVVEPIWSLEIIASSVLAFFIIHEKLNSLQITLMTFLILGLVLVSLRSYHFDKRIWLEKGVFLAILSAIVMGSANFFIGLGSRESNGLMVNWFLNCFMAISCLIYIVYNRKFKKMIRDFRKSKKEVMAICFFDNMAWIAFAIAMTLASISITVAITESYIILAVLLGIFAGKEKIKFHQKIGLVFAVLSAIYLAYSVG